MNVATVPCLLVLLCACSLRDSPQLTPDSCAEDVEPAGYMDQVHFDRTEAILEDMKRQSAPRTQWTERGSQDAYQMFAHSSGSFYLEYARLASGDHPTLACLIPTEEQAAAYRALLGQQDLEGDWTYSFLNPEESLSLTLVGRDGQVISVTYKGLYLD